MWVNIESFDEADEFINFCEAIHGDEDDPELMFQDYQNFPKAFYSESGLAENFDVIKEYAVLDYPAEALETWIDEMSNDNFDNFEDCYRGEFESERDYAEQLFNDCYADNMPEFATRYFDYDAFARDLFLDGYVFANGYVFYTY